MNKNPIGIFDSGIGGFSVVGPIEKLLPNESIIYLADKANFPYGEKTPTQIRKISAGNVKWLLKHKAKLIVVACNTATVNAISFLRQKFPKVFFIGMEPVIKPASKLSKKGIIILSSPKAAKSKQLTLLMKKYIKKEVNIFNIGSLELVQAVENQWNFYRIKKVLATLISPRIVRQADVLVLGCTHFPLIKDYIQEFVGQNIKVIDSGEAVAERTKVILAEKKIFVTSAGIKRKPNYKFFTTGVKESIGGITLEEIVK